MTQYKNTVDVMTNQFELLVFPGYGDKGRSGFATTSVQTAGAVGIPYTVIPACREGNASVRLHVMTARIEEAISASTAKKLVIAAHSLAGVLLLKAMLKDYPGKEIAGVVMATPPIAHREDFVNPLLKSSADARASWAAEQKVDGPYRLVYNHHFVDDLEKIVTEVVRDTRVVCPLHIIGINDDTLVREKSVAKFTASLSGTSPIVYYSAAEGEHPCNSEEASRLISQVLLITLKQVGYSACAPGRKNNGVNAGQPAVPGKNAKAPSGSDPAP